MLFFDPRLSSTGTVSCFSCHNVMEGGDDDRSVSIGVHGQMGSRNAPTGAGFFVKFPTQTMPRLPPTPGDLLD
jgi:cytochrome c peroxidase